MRQEKTVAQRLVSLLKTAKLDCVFGLPGGENVEVMEALRQEGIRFVLVRNESSAVFMADVYARLTGKLGVCLTTLGPGATNAFVGMAHADLDRAGVLLITAETNQSLLPDHTHQVYDLQSIFKPITKFSSSLNPENIFTTVEQALGIMKEGRLGPVHLSLSREMAAKPVLEKIRATTKELKQASLTKLEASLQAAKKVITEAKKPILIAGLGLEPQKPYGELMQFAESINAPVIVTPKAKGALSDKHSLSAGTLGLTRNDPVYELIKEADLIIAIGFDVVELVKPWQEQAELIWIAAWENLQPTIPASIELTGNIPAILKQLTLSSKADETWGQPRVATFQHALNTKPLPKAAQGYILPQDVFKIARAYVPDDCLVTTDVGSHKIASALLWPAYQPNRYMLSNGLSAMGFGLSAAIAGAVALEQVTLCITGDAGFSMVMGELGIIKELELPVITLIMNDSALDLIRSAQQRSGHESFGTEFLNPDFKHIAAAYDLEYYLINSIESCQQVFQAAFTKAKACVIEAVIDPISYPTTPH